MPGIPGQYFRQFGLTVAIAVLFSLLVARLITPTDGGLPDARQRRPRGGAIATAGSCAAISGSSGARCAMRYLTLLAAIGVLAVSLYLHAADPGQLHPARGRQPRARSASSSRRARRWRTPTVRRGRCRRRSRASTASRTCSCWAALAHGRPDVRRASVTVLLKKLDHSLVRKVLRSLATAPVVGALVPEVEPHGRVRRKPRSSRRSSSPCRDFRPARLQAERPRRAGHLFSHPVVGRGRR